METNKHYLFLKIGALEHMQSLQKEGLVYCNPITYFLDREKDNGDGRIDVYENVVEIIKPKTDHILLKPAKDENAVFKKLSVTSLELRKYISEPAINLFCLYAFELPMNEPLGIPFKIPLPKIGGDTCLLITNPQEFVNRIMSFLISKNLSYEYSFVKYISYEQHTIKKDVFMKHERYADQREFRFAINGKHNEPLSLSIGDISDISILYQKSFLMNAEFKLDTNA